MLAQGGKVIELPQHEFQLTHPLLQKVGIIRFDQWPQSMGWQFAWQWTRWSVNQGLVQLSKLAIASTDNVASRKSHKIRLRSTSIRIQQFHVVLPYTIFRLRNANYTNLSSFEHRPLSSARLIVKFGWRHETCESKTVSLGPPNGVRIYLELCMEFDGYPDLHINLGICIRSVIPRSAMLESRTIPCRERAFFVIFTLWYPRSPCVQFGAEPCKQQRTKSSRWLQTFYVRCISICLRRHQFN